MGLVTLLEVIDHFRALEKDPNCPDLLDVFLDLSEVDSLPETRQVSIVINEMKKIRGQVRFGACAILASREACMVMMRVFEVMEGVVFRGTCYFRAANEAEAWLASQQSLANHKPDPTG